MVGALAETTRTGEPLSRVLAAEGITTPETVLAAQAERFGALVVRRDETPPDDTLAGLLPAAFCLEHGVLPWRRIGDSLLVATSRPDAFDTLRETLPAELGPVMMAVTLEADIHDSIAASHGQALIAQAETMRPLEDSCRDLNESSLRGRLCVGLALVMVLTGFWFAPELVFAAGLALALASLVVAQGLKLAALLASRPKGPAIAPKAQLPAAPPRVSLLVPLFREQDIARTLIARLSRLTYPRSLLDVMLILEQDDTETREALRAVALPPWFRVIEVPCGTLLTKPRAMNYALRFTDAPILGIYDAEDSPAPDQIERVTAHFCRAPPTVGCLQGILDFYNPRANWLSRCFAIEYAAWFRVLLPGLAHMGLAVPLGGTTVFFRRDALLAAGGWDAHNVTEDADLGILLARRGYRTELVPTVTREEANNRFWPWVRQRSRWLKGYTITWWVHTRRPLALWRALGPRRFFGMQALFLTTILQFTLAPILWSFWLLIFGLPHPLDPWLTPGATGLLTTVFLAAEATALFVGFVAVSRSPHERLMPWVPTLFLYFPLGSLAIYKGMWEVLSRNAFYWDKTEHGHSAPDTPSAETPERLPKSGIQPD
ncbi:glycosyltransferase [Cognatishimia sp. F0-27]|nr:glycosyltransferase [Cognatishimia sp. F0-27]